MRRNTVVSAPRHARVDAPNLALDEATPATRATASRRAYCMAMGRLAVRNVRETLGWWIDTLRLPSDRARRDEARRPDEH